MLQAFFQESRDIGDMVVLRDVATAIGLDGSNFEQALRDGTLAQTHRAALDVARVEGIRSVPTFQLGRTRFEHVPSAAQLRSALA